MIQLSLTKSLKKFDDLINRKFREVINVRYILFFVHNMMTYIHLYPLYLELKNSPRNKIFFTSPNLDSIKNLSDPFFDLSPLWHNFLSLKSTRWKKWDVILCADYILPWYYRYSKFVQTFHGVAAKKTPEISDYRFHPNLKKFDLIFFPNECFLREAVAKNLISSDKGFVTGLFVMDYLCSLINMDRKTLKKQLFECVEGLSKFSKIVMWAPTFISVNLSSWLFFGEIMSLLSSASDIFIVIKPHPNIFRKKSKVQFENDLKSLFPRKNYLVCYSDPYPFLVATDLYIGDFSSLSFEYCFLKKPLIYLSLNKNEKDMVADFDQYRLLLQASYIVGSIYDLPKIVRDIGHVTPSQAQAMDEIIVRYFQNLGQSSKYAVKILKNYNLVF